MPPIRFNRALFMPQVSARFLPVLALLTLAAFSRAGAQQPLLPTFEDGAHADFRNGLEQETFFLVNQYRKSSKLPPLQWDGVIAKVARGHSKDMATGDVDFGHDGFSRRITQLRTVMIGLRGAGENVLRTDNPDQVARTAVDLWLHSPRHLENIRGDYNYSGLGVWVDDKGMIYFTQIFVNIQPQTQETQAAPPPQVVTPLSLLAPPRTRAGP